MKSRIIALVAVYVALGVTLAPFLWFQFITTKAYPTQHFINTLSGTTLGPWWATLVAVFIGVIRNMLGIGTIYAFPGGIPGAILVGLGFRLTRRFKNRWAKYSAAFLEPVGTVLIGGTTSLLLIAPLIGDMRFLSLIEERGLWNVLIFFWAGWSASSVPGSIIGYVTLVTLDKLGVISTLVTPLTVKEKLPVAKMR
ncbi:MAG: energy coupling factor transporter S component ThiW [Nitrososphaerota archaeon]